MKYAADAKMKTYIVRAKPEEIVAAQQEKEDGR